MLEQPSKACSASVCTDDERFRPGCVGVLTGELKSNFDRKATVGSKEASEKSRCRGIPEVFCTGGDIGNDGVPAAVGKIKGLRDAAPEGKRRMRRCLWFAFVYASVSGGKGSPQENAPKELLEYSDVGLDEDDGGD
ncbi:MAG: hypothetical protein LQ343_003415 [Gyalolechia ehrenbergii]|nr:MAG: hypothetical protein LQ343_003415 [Gyalolechia ehrenbergii]